MSFFYYTRQWWVWDQMLNWCVSHFSCTLIHQNFSFLEGSMWTWKFVCRRTSCRKLDFASAKFRRLGTNIAYGIRWSKYHLHPARPLWWWSPPPWPVIAWYEQPACDDDYGELGGVWSWACLPTNGLVVVDSTPIWLWSELLCHSHYLPLPRQYSHLDRFHFLAIWFHLYLWTTSVHGVIAMASCRFRARSG